MYNTSFVMCDSVGLLILRLEGNGNGYSNNVNGNYYSGPNYFKSNNQVIIT